MASISLNSILAKDECITGIMWCNDGYSCCDTDHGKWLLIIFLDLFAFLGVVKLLQKIVEVMLCLAGFQQS